MTSRGTDMYPSSGESYGTPATFVEPDDKSSISSFDGEDTMKELQVPIHPISSMQGAFAESMLEASAGPSPTSSKADGANAASRRQKLLDQEIEEDTHASKWRQKPGQRYHELWKLMAQISFGIYLLLNGIAKDDEQVLNILQGHVDEVDRFLEVTLEDFDLAIQDIEERLKYLKMPVENILIFDTMLEDRQFRLQIVTGNERIEHIIHRTASAMKDALKHVQQGLDATKEFAIYLAEEQEDPDWKMSRPDMQKVYDAMKGNAEGWYKAYLELQAKGNHLSEILVQLGCIVAEMNKRAGQVSRKMRFSITPNSAPALPITTKSAPSSHRTAPSHHSRPSVVSATSSKTKDLPSDPNIITPAIRANLPAFQYVSDRERAPEPTILEAGPGGDEQESKIENVTLQPRTYSPVPQSNAPTKLSNPEAASAPDVPLTTHPKKRFSLKKTTPPEKNPTPKPLTPPSRQPQTIMPVKSSPPSRGLPDSAYGSDTDKIVYHNNTSSDYFGIRPNVSYVDRPASDYVRSPASPKAQQILGAEVAGSPKSDHQFYPVRASPHSPLQRPWTATPHSPSNLRSQTSCSKMSQMTTATENGTRIKKKKSGFGWLKKAFSLSEEEKRIFEEKRRGDLKPREYAADRKPPQFRDGRRPR